MKIDHPKIPLSHFMRELHKAMELILKNHHRESKTKQEIIRDIREKSRSSRPWAFILTGYQNHDEDFLWLENWCTNCLKISRL